MAEKHGTYIVSQSVKWQLGHKPPGSENGSRQFSPFGDVHSSGMGRKGNCPARGSLSPPQSFPPATATSPEKNPQATRHVHQQRPRWFGPHGEIPAYPPSGK